MDPSPGGRKVNDAMLELHPATFASTVTSQDSSARPRTHKTPAVERSTPHGRGHEFPPGVVTRRRTPAHEIGRSSVPTDEILGKAAELAHRLGEAPQAIEETEWAVNLEVRRPTAMVSPFACRAGLVLYRRHQGTPLPLQREVRDGAGRTFAEKRSPG